MKRKQEPYFEDMTLAFALCREKGRPIIANILGVRFKLYPSGRADSLPCLNRKPTPKEFPKMTAEQCAEVRNSMNAIEAGLTRLIGYSRGSA